MIKKIEFIKEFGIYNNFEWSANPGLKDFTTKNIFYGWNYSGKTTFSRLFSSMKDKIIHKDFQSGSFKVITDHGTFTNETLENFPYKIEVFNSEYIKENLRWEYDDNINAISFEVGEDAKIAQEIADNLTEIDLINGTDVIKGKKEPYKSDIAAYGAFEQSFTEEAKRIKNDIFSSLIEFRKDHLKKIRDAVVADLNKSIIGDEAEIKRLNKVIKIENPKDVLPLVVYSPAIINLKESLNACLAKNPEKIKVIEILEDKSNYEWVKSGIALHEKQEQCLFCANPISEDRIDELIAFFNNEASLLKSVINEISEQLKQEVTALEEINLPLSINDFNEGFQNDYENLKEKFDDCMVKCTDAISAIEESLNKKANENLYRKIEIEVGYMHFEELVLVIKQINDCINKNNDFSINFTVLIDEERTKYKKHLVAAFLKSINYLSVKKKSETGTTEIKAFDELIAKLQKRNTELYSQISNVAAGCEQLNLFIRDFLNREDITICVSSEDKKFNLKRGDYLAKNLSEGEKSAIAFSYFLVYLGSLKAELANCIIFIDDPISSLDSNHIFQINSILKDAFSHKVPNPANNGENWDLKCNQLFVSTHNFEFFNLLKELQPKSKTKESRYFITRKLLDATILPLPVTFDKHSSEYHYLFSEISSFSLEVNKSASPKLILMPNIFRRFVELYTLTKYPSADEVDIRADKVFGSVSSKRILKVLHFFSHLNNIDRIAKQSDYISDIDIATSQLIDHIKTNDALHYEALQASLIEV